MIRRLGIIFRKFSEILGNFENLVAVYATLAIIIIVVALFLVPTMTYYEDQLYPKEINRSSHLDPYDRGGLPFEKAEIKSQYPENSKTAGYVTAYLTPLSWFMANTTGFLGMTIVAHPGGILDEILYNTRGFDTVVETSILFCAFAMAAYIFRRREL